MHLYLAVSSLKNGFLLKETRTYISANKNKAFALNTKQTTPNSAWKSSQACNNSEARSTT